jgi:hypothetical protein
LSGQCADREIRDAAEETLDKFHHAARADAGDESEDCDPSDDETEEG